MSKSRFEDRTRGVRTCRQWMSDDCGVAAVEFALMAPVIVLLAVGVADLGALLMKYRHASQAAGSIAQTAAYLSIADRDGSKGAGNTLTKDQDAMLKNGLAMVLGKDDTLIAQAEAKRVIRNGDKFVTDWIWSYGGTKGNQSGKFKFRDGKDSSPEQSGSSGSSQFPLDTGALAAQMAKGESIMVVDVAFKHDFFYSHFFGKGQKFMTHYTAGIPSY